MTFHSYPEIKQFRHAITTVTDRAQYTGKASEGVPVYDRTRPVPSLSFTGTTKLHGTNGGIRGERTDSGWRLFAQSRERDLSPEDDNCGFASWTFDTRRMQVVTQMVASLCAASPKFALCSSSAQVILFGEFVGPRVNAKTGIGKLPERFVVFGLAVYEDDAEDAPATWLNVADMFELMRVTNEVLEADMRAVGIYPITDFKTWTLEIDFSNPETALDPLEQLTQAVEEDCPVAQSLGGSGIGEGIVWMHTSPEFGNVRFKTKGMKHKGTKAQRLVEIAPEVIASRTAFVEAVLTESRLEQGLAYLREHGIAYSLDNIGTYLQWIGKDVIKEESDTLAASGLDKSQVMKSVNHEAKQWYLSRVNPLAV